MANIRIHVFSSPNSLDKRLRALIESKICEMVRFARDSEFAQKNEDLRDRSLPDEKLLDELVKRGYDVLVATINGEYAGICAFQKHPASWESFLYYVPAALEGSGVGHEFVRAFIALSFDAGVTSIRIWAGDSDKKLSERNRKRMEHLMMFATSDELNVPFCVEAMREVGWIRLSSRPSTASVELPPEPEMFADRTRVFLRGI